MRAVIQRVSSANVVSNGILTGSIGRGLLILLGITVDDEKEDAIWLVNKIWQMRIFPDQEEKMNLSMKDIDGEMLLISQFTLYASTKKGNRPSFLDSARPEQAIPLYEYFKSYLEKVSATEIKTGTFGADMKVSLLNDGPVTIILDSKNKE
jgi:D-tyrosyl-tRNA(Tyr) deacylase